MEGKEYFVIVLVVSRMHLSLSNAVSHQGTVAAAGGVVIGHATSGVIGKFPYQGGPKGFDKLRVDVIYVDECFLTERCCGIIGKANGFGIFDRFCVKNECLVKAHKKSHFSPTRRFLLHLGAETLRSVVISKRVGTLWWNKEDIASEETVY